MAKKSNTDNEMIKEALGIFAVLLITGLILVAILLISRCDGTKEPDPHDATLNEAVITDTETGIKYIRCPYGIGANTLKDAYLTLGDAEKGIKLYTIMFEDPEKYISEAKNTLGGAYVYRAEGTDEITLEGFEPNAAGIFMGTLSEAIDRFYEKEVAEKGGLEDGTKYVNIIQNALLNQESVSPTGEFTDEDFYIRLYSAVYPGLYYEVIFCTDENGAAYLLDSVTGKLVACPDELTVRIIG